MRVKATVLIPTTKDRAPVLPFSVRSVLNQSIKEIEVFIIGDGVDEKTRDVIHDLMKEDERIFFFDHQEKGPRRGEIYRHEALINHAKGTIVCYLLDRDLMLTDHVKSMYANLEKHNFSVQTSIDIAEDSTIKYVYKKILGTYVNNDLGKKSEALLDAWFTFSQVGHTLDFYKKLPFGWRTTPDKYATDVYMWRQFTNHPDLSFISTMEATILYFQRGGHPGWPAERRAEELKKYYPILQNKQEVDKLVLKATTELMRDRLLAKTDLLIIKGRSIRNITKIKSVKGFARQLVEYSFLNRFIKRW